MEMYSLEIDKFITNTHPCFSKGVLTHYIAKDYITGDIVEITLKDYSTFVDIEECEALN